MYYVYILLSQKDGRTYVGYSENLQRRLNDHNQGKVTATKRRKPFTLFYSEQLESKQEAKKRELWWKSGAGRRKMKIVFKERFQ